MDDAAFREKLKNMAKQSKQTFSRLAHLFSRGGSHRLLGHAPAPSKDNLLLSADPMVEEARDSEEESSEDESGDEEKHSTTKVSRRTGISVADPGCFYPGSRILTFIHPGISGQQEQQKRGIFFCCFTFFSCHKLHKSDKYHEHVQKKI
jgi:hypothetical protein